MKMGTWAFPARILDFLWATLTLALAAPCLRYAWEYRDIQAGIYFLIHLQVAVLFLARTRVLCRPTKKLAYLIAIASTFYSYLFRFEESRSHWSPVGPALTLVGSVLCAIAILSLGRRFGVLPAFRGLATEGLYRAVRHPIYACYLIMDAGILLEHASLWNLGVCMLGFGLLLGRIQYEEMFLTRVVGYSDYKKTVTWRLLPGIY